MRTRTLTTFAWLSIAVVLALVLDVGCKGSQSDAPGSPSNPFDKPNVTVTVSPNPVPFSGQPITTGACVGSPNTWFYTEVFTESTDVLVTLNAVTQGLGPNAGVTTSLTAPASNPYKYTIPANGSQSLPYEQCIGTPNGGMIQHTYSGTDFNGQPVTIVGPTVTLSAK